MFGNNPFYFPALPKIKNSPYLRRVITNKINSIRQSHHYILSETALHKKRDSYTDIICITRQYGLRKSRTLRRHYLSETAILLHKWFPTFLCRASVQNFFLFNYLKVYHRFYFFFVTIKKLFRKAYFIAMGLKIRYK